MREDWTVVEHGCDPEQVARRGNTFLIGNGYLGYRGTLEEYGRQQLVGCTLAGLYDRVGEKWREPVNAPNGLFCRLLCEGEPVAVFPPRTEIASHEQGLCFRYGIHFRNTRFRLADETGVVVSAERFACLEPIHVLAMKFSFSVSDVRTVAVETGIDRDVWDLNGPHLGGFQLVERDCVRVLEAYTQGAGIPVATAEIVVDPEGVFRDVGTSEAGHRLFEVRAEPDRMYTLYKFVAIYTGKDVADPVSAAADACMRCAAAGYEVMLQRHRELWDARWAVSDVAIVGDPEAGRALRYSMYQLWIAAPEHAEALSIPARALSGQVYKGAVFWDTEVFMLPFFLHTRPDIAQKLLRYRIRTLDGARRKAAEYGRRGAFYAWESQDTGDDACTLFNVSDVLTGRPIRTYFRDKQIHISGAVVYGFRQYARATGDDSLWLAGGAEAVLECARFYLSWAYYKPDKDRYEWLDVTGPDEYHERVHNNAYTNAMVRFTLRTACELADRLRKRYPAFWRELVDRLGFRRDLADIRRMLKRVYVPQPDDRTRLIEQFDGYFGLRDATPDELKVEMLHPHEYLGGGNGLAAHTRVVKQADVIALLALFEDDYPVEVRRANWAYYEPRTEHGSSLSAPLHALVAAGIGEKRKAYDYFMRAATIDLTGAAKTHVGDLYIGGTHPAANGGAWMAAVHGFCGVRVGDDAVRVAPALPDGWEAVELPLAAKGGRFALRLTEGAVRVRADDANPASVPFVIGGKGGKTCVLRPGETIDVRLA